MKAENKWQKDINTAAGGAGGVTGQCVMHQTEAYRLRFAAREHWRMMQMS